jgi:hypothetical protein
VALLSERSGHGADATDSEDGDDEEEGDADSGEGVDDEAAARGGRFRRARGKGLLTLQWRPIYYAVQQHLTGTSGRPPAPSAVAHRHLEIAGALARRANCHFPASAATEIAVMVSPHFEHVHTVAPFMALAMLRSLLPKDMRADQLPDGTLAHWLRVWSWVDRTPSWDVAWFEVFGRFVKRSSLPYSLATGDESLSSGNRMDWCAQCPFLFSRLLALFNPPVEGVTAPQKRVPESARLFMGRLQAEGACARLVARLLHVRPSAGLQQRFGDPDPAVPLSPSSEAEADGLPRSAAGGGATGGSADGYVGDASVLGHVERFLRALSTFFHPSSSIQPKALNFVMEMACQVSARYGRESGERQALAFLRSTLAGGANSANGGTGDESPSDHVQLTRAASVALSAQQPTLTGRDLARFVDATLPLAMMGLYASARSANQSCNRAVIMLRQLFALAPAVVTREVLTFAGLALDPSTLNESHLTVNALTALGSLTPLFLYPIPRMARDLPLLLQAALPGLDPNDDAKTEETLMFFSAVTTHVFFVDDADVAEHSRRCQKVGDGDDDVLARLPAWHPAAPGYAVPAARALFFGAGDTAEAMQRPAGVAFGASAVYSAGLAGGGGGGNVASEELDVAYRTLRAQQAGLEVPLSSPVSALHRASSVGSDFDYSTQEASAAGTSLEVVVRDLFLGARDSQTQLSTWFLAALDRCLLLLEAKEAQRRPNNDTVLSCILRFVPHGFQHCSPRLRDKVTERTSRFLHDSLASVDCLHTVRKLLRYLTIADPGRLLAALFERHAQKALATGGSDDLRRRHMLVLCGLVKGAGPDILPYVPTVRQVIALGFAETEDARVWKAAGKLLRCVLHALHYPVQLATGSDPFHCLDPPSSEQYSELWWRWGAPAAPTARKVGSDDAAAAAGQLQPDSRAVWYRMGMAERAAVLDIINEFLVPAMRSLQACIAVPPPSASAAAAAGPVAASASVMLGSPSVGVRRAAESIEIRKMGYLIMSAFRGAAHLMTDGTGTEGDDQVFAAATAGHALVVEQAAAAATSSDATGMEEDGAAPRDRLVVRFADGEATQHCRPLRVQLHVVIAGVFERMQAHAKAAQQAAQAGGAGSFPFSPIAASVNLGMAEKAAGLAGSSLASAAASAVATVAAWDPRAIKTLAKVAFRLVIGRGQRSSKARQDLQNTRSMQMDSPIANVTRMDCFFRVLFASGCRDAIKRARTVLPTGNLVSRSWRLYVQAVAFRHRLAELISAVPRSLHYGMNFVSFATGNLIAAADEDEGDEEASEAESPEVAEAFCPPSASSSSAASGGVLVSPLSAATPQDSVHSVTTSVPPGESAVAMMQEHELGANRHPDLMTRVTHPEVLPRATGTWHPTSEAVGWPTVESAMAEEIVGPKVWAKLGPRERSYGLILAMMYRLSQSHLESIRVLAAEYLRWVLLVFPWTRRPLILRAIERLEDMVLQAMAVRSLPREQQIRASADALLAAAAAATKVPRPSPSAFLFKDSPLMQGGAGYATASVPALSLGASAAGSGAAIAAPAIRPINPSMPGAATKVAIDYDELAGNLQTMSLATHALLFGDFAIFERVVILLLRLPHLIRVLPLEKQSRISTGTLASARALLSNYGPRAISAAAAHSGWTRRQRSHRRSLMAQILSILCPAVVLESEGVSVRPETPANTAEGGSAQGDAVTRRPLVANISGPPTVSAAPYPPSPLHWTYATIGMLSLTTCLHALPHAPIPLSMDRLRVAEAGSSATGADVPVASPSRLLLWNEAPEEVWLLALSEVISLQSLVQDAAFKLLGHLLQARHNALQQGYDVPALPRVLAALRDGKYLEQLVMAFVTVHQVYHQQRLNTGNETESMASAFLAPVTVGNQLRMSEYTRSHLHGNAIVMTSAMLKLEYLLRLFPGFEDTLFAVLEKLVASTLKIVKGAGPTAVASASALEEAGAEADGDTRMTAAAAAAAKADEVPATPIAAPESAEMASVRARQATVAAILYAIIYVGGERNLSETERKQSFAIGPDDWKDAYLQQVASSSSGSNRLIARCLQLIAPLLDSVGLDALSDFQNAFRLAMRQRHPADAEPLFRFVLANARRAMEQAQADVTAEGLEVPVDVGFLSKAFGAAAAGLYEGGDSGGFITPPSESAAAATTPSSASGFLALSRWLRLSWALLEETLVSCTGKGPSASVPGLTTAAQQITNLRVSGAAAVVDGRMFACRLFRQILPQLGRLLSHTYKTIRVDVAAAMSSGLCLTWYPAEYEGSLPFALPTIHRWNSMNSAWEDSTEPFVQLPSSLRRDKWAAGPLAGISHLASALSRFEASGALAGGLDTQMPGPDGDQQALKGYRRFKTAVGACETTILLIDGMTTHDSQLAWPVILPILHILFDCQRTVDKDLSQIAAVVLPFVAQSLSLSRSAQLDSIHSSNLIRASKTLLEDEDLALQRHESIAELKQNEADTVAAAEQMVDRDIPRHLTDAIIKLLDSISVIGAKDAAAEAPIEADSTQASTTPADVVVTASSTSVRAEAPPTAVRARAAGGDASRSLRWGARAAVLPSIVAMRSRALFAVTKEQDTLLQKIVEARVYDKQVEVREEAGHSLGAFVMTMPHREQLRIADMYSKLLETKLPRKVQPPASFALATPEELEGFRKYKVRLTNALAKRHSGCLGVSAYVAAHPFDVPAELPAYLAALARHGNDPQPVASTVRTTIQDFRTTHSDAWELHRQAFDADQLADINATSSGYNYYL